MQGEIEAADKRLEEIRQKRVKREQNEPEHGDAKGKGRAVEGAFVDLMSD